LQYIAGAEAGT